MLPDKKKSDQPRKNEQLLKYSQVLLVQDGKKLGVFPSRVALAKAQEAELDLIEVSPNAKPPVCSLGDYGKFMYERNKSKKQKVTHIIREKEIRFRPVTEDNDLVTKINQAKKFLEKGDRVKLVVKFKAREHAHKEQGWTLIQKAVDMLKDVSTIEKAPSCEGSLIIARLTSGKAPVKSEDLIPPT